MGFRELFILLIGFALVAVILRGLYVAIRARRGQIRVDLAKNIPDYDFEAERERAIRAELPNGGARVVERSFAHVVEQNSKFAARVKGESASGPIPVLMDPVTPEESDNSDSSRTAVQHAATESGHSKNGAAGEKAQNAVAEQIAEPDDGTPATPEVEEDESALVSAPVSVPEEGHKNPKEAQSARQQWQQQEDTPPEEMPDEPALGAPEVDYPDEPAYQSSRQSSHQPSRQSQHASHDGRTETDRDDELLDYYAGYDDESIDSAAEPEVDQQSYAEDTDRKFDRENARNVSASASAGTSRDSTKSSSLRQWFESRQWPGMNRRSGREDPDRQEYEKKEPEIASGSIDDLFGSFDESFHAGDRIGAESGAQTELGLDYPETRDSATDNAARHAATTGDESDSMDRAGSEGDGKPRETGRQRRRRQKRQGRRDARARNRQADRRSANSAGSGGNSADQDKEGKAGRRSAPVDPSEVVVLNVMAKTDRLFTGHELFPVLMTAGLRFGEMNIFHYHAGQDESAPVIFSAANILNPGTFDLNEIGSFSTRGVCFFLTLPSPVRNMEAFDAMLEAARTVKEGLDGELKDDNRSVMTAQTIEHYRQRIRDFQLRELKTAGGH